MKLLILLMLTINFLISALSNAETKITGNFPFPVPVPNCETNACEKACKEAVIGESSLTPIHHLMEYKYKENKCLSKDTCMCQMTGRTDLEIRPPFEYINEKCTEDACKKNCANNTQGTKVLASQCVIGNKKEKMCACAYKR